MTSLSMIYVPCPSVEVAKRLATGLLEGRLVACANILPDMTSLYWWEGEIQEDAEAILLLKTAPKHVMAVEAFIQDHHPYRCPAVIQLAVDGANAPFLAWLAEKTNVKSRK